MKFRLPFLGWLLILITTIGLVFFRQERMPGGQKQTQVASPSPNVVSANSAALATPAQLAKAAERPRSDDEILASVPLESIKALVRLKLKEWRETQTEDDEARQRLLEVLIGLLTKENVAELTRMLSGEELNSPFGLAAQRLWLETSSTEAARWIAAQPDSTEEQARLVARQLLGDEVGLRTFCDELRDSAWKENFLAVASLESLEKNPLRAAALAQRMKPGPEQTNVLETVVYDWAVHDLKGAIGLVETVSDPALRERALAMTAKAIAVGDPDLGAQWLAASVKSEGMLKETAQCVVEIWAEKSPTEAAQWLLRTTDVNVRANAVSALLHAWLKRDPTAAQAWIKTLPEGHQVEAMLAAEQEEGGKSAD